MNFVVLTVAAVTAVFAVAGLFTGFVKGFTRVKSWAVELSLTCILGICISNLIKSDNPVVKAAASLAVTLILLCLFMVNFAVLRKVLSKKIERNIQKHNEQLEAQVAAEGELPAEYGSFEEPYAQPEYESETEMISVTGIEEAQTAQPEKKKREKKPRAYSGGGYKIADRVLGSFTLAVKGAAISLIFFSILLAIIDFSRLAADGGSLNGIFGSLYTGKFWLGYRNYIFDIIIVGIIMISIKSSYARGLTSAVWMLTVIALVAGAFALAYHLAFNVPEFVNAADGLYAHLFADIPESLQEIITVDVAKIIICALVFIFLLIAVILVAVFVPKLIDSARDGAVFSNVDGILGAIFVTAFILALLFVVGAVLKPFGSLGFMEAFNVYFEKSGIATYFYNNNPIEFNIPVTEWFG